MKRWLAGLAVPIAVVTAIVLWSPRAALSSMNSAEIEQWGQRCLTRHTGTTGAARKLRDDLEVSGGDTIQAVGRFAVRECPPRWIKKIVTGEW